jgi:hypothetical protein
VNGFWEWNIWSASLSSFKPGSHPYAPHFVGSRQRTVLGFYRQQFWLHLLWLPTSWNCKMPHCHREGFYCLLTDNKRILLAINPLSSCNQTAASPLWSLW